MTSWLWLIEVLSINGVVSSSFRTNTISCAFVRNYDGPLLNLMMGFDQVLIVFFHHSLNQFTAKTCVLLMLNSPGTWM